MELLSSAVLFVEVTKPDGSLDIGSAFHIGNGYCVTARHVLEGNTVRTVGRRDTSLKTHFTTTGTTTTSLGHSDFTHSVVDEIFFHANDKVDAAIFRLGGTIPTGLGYSASRLQPAIPLDRHTDQLTEGEFLLKEVVVLGYPKIPWADVHLVVFRGDVSAVIESHQDHQRHFVVSGMARGGFSGGPIIASETNTVLGIVTDSLVHNDQVTELGFLNAVSIQAARDIITASNLSVKV